MDIYSKAEDYLSAPDGMKNEVTMWFIAAGLLMQEISKQEGNLPFGGLGNKSSNNIQNKSTVKVLDVCSGPGNFVNHILYVNNNIEATCVDLNKIFIHAGQKLLKQVTFLLDNAITMSLDKKYDFILCSSAYHHIQDKDKEKFLSNLSNHLKSKGKIIICENFLPEYSNLEQKKLSIAKYYKQLVNYYKQGNSTKNSLTAINQVKDLELSGGIEYKVSFSTLKAHLQTTNLVIELDIPVWQPKSFIKDNSGSHVLVVAKNQ